MTTGARLMAALECANDAGGRCALWPSGDARRCCGVGYDTATSCAYAAGSVSAARAALTGTGATPQSEGLVRVRRQVCLRTPAPVPSGSLPANYPYAGRRFSAAPATVVQPQSSQRHAEPLARTWKRRFRAHARRCRCARAVRHRPPPIGGQDRPPEPLSTRLQNNLPIIAPDS